MNHRATGGASPAVSVLIAVRNGLPYVESAVRSMMAQTLRDIEIVVVDDASTDGTPEVLHRLAAEDGRIHVEVLERNLRLPGALNHGLGLVRAPLVARMDADDLSEPTRLEVQKRYMDAHPGVVLVGTGFRRIDRNGKAFDVKSDPYDAYAVRWMARLQMPLVHPTFMFRSRLPGGEAPRYDPSWTHSEDYDLQVRLLDHGEVVRLPDILLSWRAHGNSITGNSWKICQQQGLEISHHHSCETLPTDVAEALMPFRRAYYLGEKVPPADIFAGFRALVAHDAAHDPSHQAWMRRQSTKLAKHAMTRGGSGQIEIARAFLGPGRDFAADMMLRALETKHMLPAALRSDPVVGDTSVSMGS